ncbi:MAG: outer membrane protein transport protein [Pseudotabrizicola sp.]|uniref:OmpP1/FadL family transporter n=1 Tax=Pseudotabrizicola sp. TaxID=2939647 RepID=UPI00272FE7A0|nr:outer membrane protein transport protein [Pseudotabrizicola sp.]MDP2082602.1 outer membrane protein transport protein [Pseudotabrizicola sp.]MDZ7573498.1 outer membrane protein transport protein [Pseudotabrizicola sp.]
MKNLVIAVGISALAAGSAQAGGLERTTQSMALLFERGNYAELSFGSVKPRVSGVGAAANPGSPTPGVPSGDMSGDYTQLGMAVKTAINDRLDFALILDTPFGAKVNYPMTGYFASGATADLKTSALTAVVRYKVGESFSVIGGLRSQTLEAVARVPFVAGYSVVGEQDRGLGYVVGVAYEKPEIALRVALTYNSKIKHNVATAEFFGLAGPFRSNTVIETPKSVNLEAQSGIAKDTLLFGSIRWVDWSAFSIAPQQYVGATGRPLVSYDNDTTTYTIGLGRRFNENWSGAVSVNYEKQSGGFAANLGPTDGRLGVTLGGTYTRDNMKITGGVSYVDIGDADTTLAPVALGLPAGNFRGNKAIGVGMKVGFTF